MHQRLRRYYEVSQERGILVIGREKKGPAAASALSEGDIIIGFDGLPVSGIDELHRLLTEAYVGRRTALTVFRGTEKLEVAIVPQEMN